MNVTNEEINGFAYTDNQNGYNAVCLLLSVFISKLCCFFQQSHYQTYQQLYPSNSQQYNSPPMSTADTALVVDSNRPTPSPAPTNGYMPQLTPAVASSPSSRTSSYVNVVAAETAQLYANGTSTNVRLKSVDVILVFMPFRSMIRLRIFDKHSPRRSSI